MMSEVDFEMDKIINALNKIKAMVEKSTRGTKQSDDELHRAIDSLKVNKYSCNSTGVTLVGAAIRALEAQESINRDLRCRVKELECKK